MKKILMIILLVLPFYCNAQLGKRMSEIESLLGSNYRLEKIGEITRYHFDYDYISGGKTSIQTYTFSFNKDSICYNWSLKIPEDKKDITYWDLEDYFKLNDLVYLYQIDKSKMNLNLFRGDGYYIVNVIYK